VQPGGLCEVTSLPVRSSHSFSLTARSPSRGRAWARCTGSRSHRGPLEVVVGDPRVEVVNVMQADVAGEELQHRRQLQVRAAAQRRVGVVPAVGVLPVGVLELMLNVEQPDAG